MSDQKDPKPGFVDSLANLLDAAKELAQAVPGAMAEVAPLLPKELQAKMGPANPLYPSVLPKEIAISFRKGDDAAWTPLMPGDTSRSGDMVGRYVLVSEAQWGEPAPVGEAEKPA